MQKPRATVGSVVCCFVLFGFLIPKSCLSLGPSLDQIKGHFKRNRASQQARLPFSPFAPARMTEGLKQQDWRKMSYVLASTPASTQEQEPHWSAKRVSGMPAFGTLSPTRLLPPAPSQVKSFSQTNGIQSGGKGVCAGGANPSQSHRFGDNYF